MKGTERIGATSSRNGTFPGDSFSALREPCAGEYVSIPFRGFRRAEINSAAKLGMVAVSIPFRGFRRAECITKKYVEQASLSPLFFTPSPASQKIVFSMLFHAAQKPCRIVPAVFSPHPLCGCSTKPCTPCIEHTRDGRTNAKEGAGEKHRFQSKRRSSPPAYFAPSHHTSHESYRGARCTTECYTIK